MYGTVFGLFLCTLVPQPSGGTIINLHGVPCILVQDNIFSRVSDCFYVKNGVDYSLKEFSGHNPNNLKCLIKSSHNDQWEELY